MNKSAKGKNATAGAGKKTSVVNMDTGGMNRDDTKKVLERCHKQIYSKNQK
jgi:hypothetical protein